MKVVLMSKLSVTVIVQTAHHDTATGATRSGGRKRIAKDDTISSDCVNGGRLGNGIAIAAQGRAFVVGDEEAVNTYRNRNRRLKTSAG